MARYAWLGALFHRLPLVALVLLLVPGTPHVARGTDRRVDPGGGGDATTIQAGLALAHAGDRVVVAAGTYAEHDLQLPAGVTLISEAGAPATIIDAGNQGHGVIGADGAVLQGFTIRHAGPLNRWAVSCYQVSPRVLDNRFVDNYERALLLYESTSEVAGNTFELYAPAPSSLVYSSQSTPYIHDNLFLADDPAGNVMAIDLFDARRGGLGAARIENNVVHGRIWIGGLSRTDTTRVTGNVCLQGNGFSEAIVVAGVEAPLLIQRNTIRGPVGISEQGGSSAIIRGNLVVDASTGIQSSGGSSLVVECNDFFHCHYPYVGVTPGANEFSADPLFCNAAQGDFHLHEDSPCAPAQAPACGLVGALGVACESTPTVRTSWGQLKVRYR